MRCLILCEGVLDMEFLSFTITSCTTFKRKSSKDMGGKSFMQERTGLNFNRYWYLVNDREDEMIISFPTGGGIDEVVRCATDISQLIAWKKLGWSKIGLALDLDEKSVSQGITSLESRLKSKFSNVVASGKFTFTCSQGGHGVSEIFTFVFVPMGNPEMQLKQSLTYEKGMIEDHLIELACTDERFQNIINQSIELYKHKTNQLPGQKSLLKLIEGFTESPDKGAFCILSSFHARLQQILPNHLQDSIKELIS